MILYAIIYLSISAKRGSSGVLLHWERTEILIHLFYNIHIKDHCTLYLPFPNSTE